MSRPIPVFSFIFTAYAATRIKVETGAALLPALSPLTPFRTAWRTQAARGVAIEAKVRLLAQSTAGDPRLAVASSLDDGEDIWLGDVVETKLGFIGRARQIGKSAAAASVPFHAIHVQDWRIDACPVSCACPQPHCEHRKPDASSGAVSGAGRS